MRARIEPHAFSGLVRVPASKSHTIRRLLIAALAGGVSEIDYPLDSLDARSCVSVCRTLGAEIAEDRAREDLCANPADREGKKLVRWTVRGKGAAWGREGSVCDVGNSGTTLFLGLAAAALGTAPVTFTGDEQIGRRSAAPLLEALAGLGVGVSSAESGCIPITVRGPWKGGRVCLPCPTSQYLSALLLAAPLAGSSGTVTEIEVPLLNERPYVELTLSYLKAQEAPYTGAADFSFFRIPGGASYKPTKGPVPGDFSSAAFPAAAAAITGGPVTLLGLDPRDTQGDKVFFDILAQMGCEVMWTRDPAPAGAPRDGGWRVRVSRQGPLRGGEFDLNAAPDLLPVTAALAAYAGGETALINAAHARIKETDRIAVMAAELGKLGVDIRERPDGLIIRGAGKRRRPSSVPITVDGRGDHRVVMALAAAALGDPSMPGGPVEIEGAESAAVTYPEFLKLLGAAIIG
ncbi:MAG: 3-phosphoshikimate 1-carboxyvinyltransferase [Spirochaetaceae bacterium]|jgi:3-phosphoshikimate 1-carboxyvinyltransferase|nr:3-phosphoshikimate 1-carboxyvinyltransferase [Spirochaetaceae bacterium]